MPTQDHTFCSAAAGLGLALALTGCGCDEDRPYTPFQVASSLPPGPDAPAQGHPADTAAPPAAAKSALVLRTSGLPNTWEAFGRTLRAPKGSGFAAGIELAGEDDQASTLAAWVLPTSEGRQKDAGLFAIDERGRPGTRLSKVPAFLPRGADCDLSLDALSATHLGIASTLSSKCKGHLLPGTPTGAFVLAPGPSSTQREPFVLRLSPGNVSEPVSITVEGRSSQGAVAELVLHIDLTAPGGAHARLPLRFVSTAGGLSRVADAPSVELEALSQELLALVPRKKERDAALQRIDALRRWIFAVCEEAGASRITDESGRAYACGGVKPNLDRLTEAMIEAYLYKDEPWKAVGEYERADYYLGEPPQKTKARWAARITEKTKVVPAAPLAEYPLELGLDVPYPFATPLRYGADGRLYGLTATGEVRRLGAPTSDPAPAEAARTDEAAASAASPEGKPAPWPLRPRSSDGRMVSGLAPSCDRPEVQLMFAASGGEPSPSIALAFLAPRPCRGLMAKPLPVEPLSWQGPALLSIAGGEPTLSQGAFLPPPRSIAWGSSLGLETLSSEGHVSWRGAALSGLHHCTPDTSGGSLKRVACVRGRFAVEIAPTTVGAAK